MKNEEELNKVLSKDELEQQNDKLKFYRTLHAQIKLFDNSFKLLIYTLNEMFGKFNHQISEIFESKISITEGKLDFVKVNNINQIQEQLKDILYSSEYEGVFGFAFHITNFRLVHNSFSTKLIILFNFTEYKYYIGTRFCESKELIGIDIESTKYSHNSLIANYYHQQLSKEIIDMTCNEIKQSLLEYFKSKENI